MNPIISIIIPVYNGEKTLRKCLDSICNQTFKNIEIICIDDGSTDNSLCLLEEVASCDRRVKVFHNDNKGALAARKFGVLQAKSKYIGFVDCDDWIEPEMYSELYTYMFQYNVDIVSSGYVYEGNYITFHYDDLQEGLYEENDIQLLRENTIYNLKTKEVGIRGALWCKLFKKEILIQSQNRISDELSFSEDKMWVLTYLLDAKSAYIMHKTFYHYIANSNSLTQTADNNYLLKVHEVQQHFNKLYQHDNFSDNMRVQAELYLTELLYKGINSRLGFKNSNLFWLDPYYLDLIPSDSKIALYGAGDLGIAYYKQLKNRKDIDVVGGIVETVKEKAIEGLKTDLLADANFEQYDYILITVKNKTKANEVKQKLKAMNIPEDKILWFEQKEIFWKFAEINGWI